MLQSAGMKPKATAESKKISAAIRAHLDHSGISRREFEKRLGRGKTTVDHLYIGQYSEKLLLKVEQILGKSFREDADKAPPEWGGYSRSATDKFVGAYVALRFNFMNPEVISAYVTKLEWSRIEKAFEFGGKVICAPRYTGYGLVFKEDRRADPERTHSGQVWIPSGGYVYLVSTYGDGRLRAAIVSHPDRDNRMMGMQFTQFNPQGAAFIPAASPIAFVRRNVITDKELGIIGPDHNMYMEYKIILEEANEAIVFAGRTSLQDKRP